MEDTARRADDHHRRAKDRAHRWEHESAWWRVVDALITYPAVNSAQAVRHLYDEGGRN